MEKVRECRWLVLVFFFKQKTAYEIKECDWSSDVCSSDLVLSFQHCLFYRFEFSHFSH